MYHSIDFYYLCTTYVLTHKKKTNFTLKCNTLKLFTKGLIILGKIQTII